MAERKNIFPSRVSKGALYLICLLLWIYIIHRAASIAITEDEAHTYLLIKTDNWRQMAGTANTHWLNSFIAKIFISLPGFDAMWKIRFLSIATWVIYAFATIKISLAFRNKWLGFTFFLFAVGNPFLIFYFSLSRGYAAACAFVMLSLWKAFQLIEAGERRPQKWVMVFLYAAIAALANFSAFYFFMALGATYLVMLISNKQLSLLFKRSALPFLLVVSGASIFSVASLLFMRHHNTLYFGGAYSVIDSLFGSMAKAFSYFENAYEHYKLQGSPYLLSDDISAGYRVTGWLIFIALVFSLIAVTKTSRVKPMSNAFFSLLICVFIVAANVLLHLLFATPYLLERTTLILYPPLLAGIFCTMDTFVPAKKKLPAFTIVSAVALVLNFYLSFSLQTFREWPVQTDTRAGLDYLRKAGAKNVALNVWHHDVFTNYYAQAQPSSYQFNYVVLPDKPDPVTFRDKILTCDYLFILPPYYSRSDLKGWRLVANFPASGSRLYKRTAAF